MSALTAPWQIGAVQETGQLAWDSDATLWNISTTRLTLTDCRQQQLQSGHCCARRFHQAPPATSVCLLAVTLPNSTEHQPSTSQDSDNWKKIACHSHWVFHPVRSKKTMLVGWNIWSAMSASTSNGTRARSTTGAPGRVWPLLVRLNFTWTRSWGSHLSYFFFLRNHWASINPKVAVMVVGAFARAVVSSRTWLLQAVQTNRKQYHCKPFNYA